MIKITINEIKKLYDQINTFFKIKSDTFCLKITYKEVLFPIYFCEKKKYFRVAYKDIVNFMPDKLFTIKVNTVKQENSKLFRFIRRKIM